ncbi:hypothetical protein [Parapoynx stagnalis nucleopolyhedrovirus]|uniref:Uncharacterized protein n=1 Tax=Parapoynx stagnalis nucleopolyhedrovirus TaxID=2993413 RepID=A0A9E8BWC1_9ABAC|nr:hypothetical protein [Parapoynx stagnalis nucleopolyhedrovirus]
MESTDKNYYISIYQHIASDFGSEKITNIKIVVLHENKNIDIEVVPACKKYETYLKTLYTNGVPTIFNIFMFYGDHGLGKTYAAFQFAKILSKNTNVILISLSMEAFLTYNDINVVTIILKKLDVNEALTFAHNYQVEHFHNNNFSCIDEKINLFDKYNLRVLINNVHVCV